MGPEFSNHIFGGFSALSENTTVETVLPLGLPGMVKGSGLDRPPTELIFVCRVYLKFYVGFCS